jgi:hypothetical protein
MFTCDALLLCDVLEPALVTECELSKVGQLQHAVGPPAPSTANQELDFPILSNRNTENWTNKMERLIKQGAMFIDVAQKGLDIGGSRDGVGTLEYCSAS